VPMDLMPLVPLWCRAMQRMGTSKRNFVDFDQTMGATTGGFSLSPFTSSIRGETDVAAYLVRPGSRVQGLGPRVYAALSPWLR